MKYFVLPVALLASVITLLGQATARADWPFPVYLAPAAPDTLTAPVMEREAFWRDVPASRGMVLFKSSPGKQTGTHGDGVTPAAGTSFKALYNANGLFLRVDCAEPAAGALDFSDHGKPYDSSAAFNSPVVEVFLDPAFTRKHAAHLAVSVNATHFDRLDEKVAWNYPFQTRILPREDKRGYAIFFFVPWLETTNENPNSGYLFTINQTSHAVIGFNVSRERNLENRELSQWSVTPRAFLQPEFFGALVLSELPAAEERMTTLFTDTIIQHGIDFQGVKGSCAASLLGKILRNKLNGAEAVLKTLGKSAEATAFADEIAALRAEMAKGGDDVEVLRQRVTAAISLYARVNDFSFQKLKNEIFDEI
jgi:hypothetical protein